MCLQHPCYDVGCYPCICNIALFKGLDVLYVQKMAISDADKWSSYQILQCKNTRPVTQIFFYCLNPVGGRQTGVSFFSILSE